MIKIDLIEIGGEKKIVAELYDVETGKSSRRNIVYDYFMLKKFLLIEFREDLFPIFFKLEKYDSPINTRYNVEVYIKHPSFGLAKYKIYKEQTSVFLFDRLESYVYGMRHVVDPDFFVKRGVINLTRDKNSGKPIKITFGYDPLEIGRPTVLTGELTGIALDDVISVITCNLHRGDLINDRNIRSFSINFKDRNVITLGNQSAGVLNETYQKLQDMCAGRSEINGYRKL